MNSRTRLKSKEVDVLGGDEAWGNMATSESV